jgi:hypothetical protein
MRRCMTAGRLANQIKSKQYGEPNRDRCTMPNGVKQTFKFPKTSWASHKRKIAKHYATVSMKIEEGAVIDCAQGDSRPLQHSQLDVYSNDPDNDDQRSTWTCHNLKDHGNYQNCSIKTAGSAQAKPHDHPQGLTHVHFGNCVVKVRTGNDLDQIVALSSKGPVKLFNVKTNGWMISGETLKPSFIFERWMSAFTTDESSDDVDIEFGDTYDPTATGYFRPFRAGAKVDIVNRD